MKYHFIITITAPDNGGHRTCTFNGTINARQGQTRKDLSNRILRYATGKAHMPNAKIAFFDLAPNKLSRETARAVSLDQASGPPGYDVYLVVIGGCDAYEAVAVYADRSAAARKAGEYNAAHGRSGDITRCARVEEISFYPSKESLEG